MKIQDLIKISTKKLTNSTSPGLDGEVLLGYVLKKPKEFLFAYPQKKIDPKSEKKYLRLIDRRALDWPVAYLTNNKEFYGRSFYVDKHVLIPRPETEGLIELVINYVKTKHKKLKIVDIGTGSGNIIISIANNATGHLFFASDISKQAIKVAKKNAKSHNVKIMFRNGNLLEPWKKERFNIIVANLPYLNRRDDISTKYEPTNALIAAKKGFALYEGLLKQIHSALPSHLLAVFLEIGHNQGPIIKKLAKKYLPAYRTKIYKDLWGRTRYASLVEPS